MLSQRRYFAGNKWNVVRLIKLAIISFIVLFLVVTAISLLIPSHIRISKAINIGGHQKASIFAQIIDTGRWQNWHPVFMTNPLPVKTASIYRILQSATDLEIVYQLRQDHHKQVTNGWKIYSYTTTDSLTLQWFMDFEVPWYPWQKFGSLFYENTYGVMMEQGLSHLKASAQSHQ